MKARISRVSDQNQFKVFGPFELKLFKDTTTLDAEGSERAITEQIKRDFPKDNLDVKGGCYVFAIRTGGGYMPWYVGKAVKSSLLKESLEPEKYEKYSKVAAQEHGTPVLLWIAKAAPGQKNSLDKREISVMEQQLVKAAALKNPNLINKHYNKPLPFEIIGVPLGAQNHPRAKKGSAAWMWRMLRASE